MKKLILVILAFVVPVFAQTTEIPLSNLQNRVITSGDTLKSNWIYIYDADSYNLFIDFGVQGDSANVGLGYWLTNEELSGRDSTSQGYFQNGQSGYLELKTIGSVSLPNNGRLYFSGQYPGNVAISPARHIQYVFWAKTDHDSLTITDANLIKFKE